MITAIGLLPTTAPIITSILPSIMLAIVLIPPLALDSAGQRTQGISAMYKGASTSVIRTPVLNLTPSLTLAGHNSPFFWSTNDM
jgi:hypothetical protein